MRIAFILAAIISLAPGAVSAAEWQEFTSVEDGFRVVFPGEPTMTESTFTSEYGVELPAHVYTVTDGPQRYSVTVVDYRDIKRLADERATETCKYGDERACGLTNAGRGYWRNEVGGALIWGTYYFLKRDITLTHLAWTWQDLVPGHEIQFTNNADKSRTFAYVTMHKNRLYLLEGTVPANYPPPALFQQSMGFVDEQGNQVRYTRIYSNPQDMFPEDFPQHPERTRPRRPDASADTGR